MKESTHTFKVSKILIISIGFATGLTISVALVLFILFRPHRYTGKAETIYDELSAPPTYTPLSRKPYESMLITDSIRSTVLRGSDSTRVAWMKDSIIAEKGKSFSMLIDCSFLEAVYYDSIVKARLPQSLLSADSIAEAQYYAEGKEYDSIYKKKWEEDRLLDDVPTVSEFFDYCDNTDGAVTWLPGSIGDIRASIESREQYLIAKIEKIAMFTFLGIFITVYSLLYFRKKRIRIVIE